MISIDDFNYGYTGNLCLVMILQLFDKKTGVHGSSSFEQGSSWAMEVENHLGVFPIMVQNINMNGQMLVEVCTFRLLNFLMHTSFPNDN